MSVMAAEQREENKYVGSNTSENVARGGIRIRDNRRQASRFGENSF